MIIRTVIITKRLLVQIQLGYKVGRMGWRRNDRARIDEVVLTFIIPPTHSTTTHQTLAHKPTCRFAQCKVPIGFEKRYIDLFSPIKLYT